MDVKDADLITWPKESGVYGVVLLKRMIGSVLLFTNKAIGRNLPSSHLGVFRRYLKDNEIHYETQDRKYGEYPEYSGKRYEVVGMGYVRVDVKQKMMIFFSSFAEFTINQDFLVELAEQYQGEWSFLKA